MKNSVILQILHYLCFDLRVVMTIIKCSGTAEEIDEFLSINIFYNRTLSCCKL